MHWWWFSICLCNDFQCAAEAANRAVLNSIRILFDVIAFIRWLRGIIVLAVFSLRFIVWCIQFGSTKAFHIPFPCFNDIPLYESRYLINISIHIQIMTGTNEWTKFLVDYLIAEALTERAFATHPPNPPNRRRKKPAEWAALRIAWNRKNKFNKNPLTNYKHANTKKTSRFSKQLDSMSTCFAYQIARSHGAGWNTGRAAPPKYIRISHWIYSHARDFPGTTAQCCTHSHTLAHIPSALTRAPTPHHLRCQPS